MRERQLAYQSKLAAARGSMAWRHSVCCAASELLLRRGRRALLIRVPRPMTGVDEKDGGVTYVRCVEVPCRRLPTASPAACAPAAAAAPAAAHPGPGPQPPGRAAAAQQTTPAGSAGPPAIHRLNTPPMLAERRPAAKRSRQQSPPGPPAASLQAALAPPAGHLLSVGRACSICRAPGSCRCRPLVIEMAAGPAAQPPLPLERSASTGSPLDRFSDWLRSLLSPLPATCPADAL